MYALVRLRRHIVFHHRRFFHAPFIPGTDTHDLTWLKPDGEMTNADWADTEARCLGFLICGEVGQHDLTAWGEPQPHDSFFVALNGGDEPITWIVPSIHVGRGCEALIDTDGGLAALAMMIRRAHRQMGGPQASAPS